MSQSLLLFSQFVVNFEFSRLGISFSTQDIFSTTSWLFIVNKLGLQMPNLRDESNNIRKGFAVFLMSFVPHYIVPFMPQLTNMGHVTASERVLSVGFLLSHSQEIASWSYTLKKYARHVLEYFSFLDLCINFLFKIENIVAHAFENISVGK